MPVTGVQTCALPIWTLTFSIIAKLIDSSRGAVSGKQLFAAMIAHFGSSNIREIKAIWVDNPGMDDNLNAFNHWTDPSLGGLSREEAATKTWTGQRAVESGFPNVVIHFDDPPLAGHHENIIVLFKP